MRLPLLALTAVLLPTSAAPQAREADVPPQHRALYDTLSAKLDMADEAIRAWPQAPRRALCFAAELITANGNRGDQLLTPRADRSVEVLLDRYREMGIGGVKLAVKYPLLRSDFPRSGEYLAFFRRTAEAARRRGLKVGVTIGPMFKEPEYTPMRVDYAGLTFDEYARHMQDMARKVCAEIRPDHMTISMEPNTVQHICGFEMSPDRSRRLITTIMDGLQKDSTLIGAGAGTWDSMEEFRVAAAMPGIDYVDMHVYPVNRQFLAERVREVADLARASSKRVIISESWLFKVADSELGAGTATSTKYFSRDPWSFWQPLDERFIRTLAAACRKTGVEFVSLFWVRHLFAYLDWDAESSTLVPGEVMKRCDAAAAAAIVRGSLSRTGQALKELIAEARGW